MNTYAIIASINSAITDGNTIATTGTGGVTGDFDNTLSTMTVGGGTPYKTVLLRFPMDVVSATDVVVQATLSVKVQSKGAGATTNVIAWARDFGTQLTVADWNIPTFNPENEQLYALQINPTNDPLIPVSSAQANSVYSCYIPTRFIHQGAGAFSDIELRPAGTPTGATDKVTIYGPGTANAADKPTLTVISLTRAELVNRNPFRKQAVGAESFFAFGQESVEGTAVRPTVILDADNIGLTLTPTTLRGTANSSNRVKPRKFAVGPTTAGGSVSFDLTPEKCWQILPGIMKLVSSTSNGNGSYNHTFKAGNSEDLAPFTFVTKKGSFRFVYPGGKISRFTITQTPTGIAKATIDLMALTEWQYDYTSAGLNDEHIMDSTAAYDTVANGLWSGVSSGITVGEQTGQLIQSFTVEFMNDFRERRGFTKQRGPNSHYPLGFEVNAKFTMDLENENTMQKILGVQSSGFPWKPGKQLWFDQIQCVLDREDNAHMLTITLPKASYETSSSPIQGEETILVDIQAVAAYSESDLSNVIVVLTTPEPATVFQPSTNVITVKPKGV